MIRYIGKRPLPKKIARKFARPEFMIHVKCNIHSWMQAYIGVVDNPCFAVSGEDGSYRIGNLPPGTYTVAIWQEKLGTQERFFILLAFDVCLALAGCNSAKPPASPAPETAAESSAPRIYVTNEVSGDLTVLDSGTRKVIATVPLGKRPRGIHASPDQKTLYVALSGSPLTSPRGRC